MNDEKKKIIQEVSEKLKKAQTFELKFYDEAHEKYYNAFIERDCTREGDVERRAMFYALALYDDTRRHIDDIYNFNGSRIEPEGLYKPWQTSGSLALTCLAFNLYNDFNNEVVKEDGSIDKLRTSPMDAFYNFRGEEREFLFNAVRMRYR